MANPAQAVAMQLDELEFLLVPSPYSYSCSFGDRATSTNQSPQHTYAANGTYNATLVVSDGLSTATIATTIYAAPPILRVSQPGAGLLGLSWPTWADDYGLRSASKLAPPIVRAPVTNDPTTAGDWYNMTRPINSTGQRFLKLQRSVNPGPVPIGP